MPSDPNAAEVAAIEALIQRQFGSLNWDAGGEGDWATFAADFHDEASLFPAARPARRQTVAAFIERMKGLAQASLPSFRQRCLGCNIQVFGDVAVALAVCGNTEPGNDVSRGVEALLLIKEAGAWKVAAQTWDMAGEGKKVPDHLLDANTES